MYEFRSFFESMTAQDDNVEYQEEGIKEHLKKHGKKYLMGAGALLAAGGAGRAIRKRSQAKAAAARKQKLKTIGKAAAGAAAAGGLSFAGYKAAPHAKEAAEKGIKKGKEMYGHAKDKGQKLIDGYKAYRARKKGDSPALES